MNTENTSAARQLWLEKAQDYLRRYFGRRGYIIPDTVRISIGWPVGQHGGAKAIGQCWAPEASADAHNEIFISPELGCSPKAHKAEQVAASVRIVGVLAHENVHAVVGNKAGHKKPFKDCAIAIGLEGKMTATTESPDFVNVIVAELIDKVGPYPAARLNRDMRKKASTRLLKCSCGACGYIARVTRKWVESSGAPVCPSDRVSMTCEDVDGEDGEE